MEVDQRLALAVAELERRREVAKFYAHFKDRHRSADGTGITDPQVTFHRSKRLGRLFVAGNRAGKSEAGAAEAIEWLGAPSGTGHVRTSWGGRRMPSLPVHGRVVTPELPLTMDKPHVIRDKVAEMCPTTWLRGGSFEKAFSVQGHTLHFANNSWLEFLSFEQEVRKHAGQSLHFVWFDEECPKIIYHENTMRLDKKYGAWWFTYTPIMGLQWIYDDLYIPAKTGKMDVELVESTVWDNMHNLREGYISDAQAGLSDLDQQTRLHGKYVLGQGLVYDLFGHGHTIDDVEVIPEMAEEAEWPT